MIWRMPDIWDYFGYGMSKIPTHRSDVTTCPCTRCRKTRGIGDAILAQSEAVRFVLNLRFLKWLAEKGKINEGWW